MNTDHGEMARISQELAREIQKSDAAPSVWEVGEIVTIEGKRGEYRVERIGRRFITLKVLPVRADKEHS